MGAFAGDFDAVLRIPPVSPSRRDYQLRSVSPQSSRPQSPWRPRDQVATDEVEKYRLYEAQGPARSSYYSGPLPSAPQGVDRSFYSGPLPTLTPPQPSYSGPLYGFPASGTEGFEFSSWAKIYHRQHASDGNSMPGSPEAGSSQEGVSARDQYADGADSVEDEPSSFYLSNPEESRARATAEFAERAGKYGRDRNCMSGELGISEAIAKQKSEVARGYKSGEILGLNICADGIYNSSPPVANVVEVSNSHRSASSAWESLMKDAKNDTSNCDSEIVAIPFKWEEVPKKGRNSVSKKPNSRTTSTSTQKVKGSGTSVKSLKSEFSFGSRHKFYGGSAKTSESASVSEVSASDVVAPPALKPVRTSTLGAKATPPKEARSAVPFKWEDAPGKPKLEDKANPNEAAPALQLPPRLVSASMKKNAWTTSTSSSRGRSSSVSRARPTKPTKQSRSGSEYTSSSVGKHSRRSQELDTQSPQPSSRQPSPQEEKPRHSPPATSVSGPLDSAARPSDDPPKAVSKSGPVSQFGLPQYQNAEFFCEASETWSRLKAVRSPTSTLHGPGSDGHSIPSSCSDSRKSQSVTCSHSGTSAESLSQWSDADHGSKDFESQDSSRAVSLGGHDEMETASASSSGATGKLRMRLHSKPSKAKPPMSPINPSPAAPSPSRIDAAGYSTAQEEFFVDFSTMPSAKTEDEPPCSPPTKLPYKMPSLSSDDDVVKPEGPSPSRALRQSSRCFEFPRFVSKSPSQAGPGKVSCCVENPSGAGPSSHLEDGYRSPAYKATLELLSPSPSVNRSSKKKDVRSVELVASPTSSRRPRLSFVVRF